MESRPLTVAAWNILLDRAHGEQVAPQLERLDDIIKTLGSLGPTDVTALMEVEKATTGHHGTIIAEKLGYDQQAWHAHSRRGEYIGLMGSDLKEIEPVELGYKKKAVITQLGDIAVAGVHLKRPHSRHDLKEQIKQTEVLLDRLAAENRAVVMGDFNCMRLQTPRRMLAAAGYRSVFSGGQERHTATVPTAHYRRLLTPRERLVSRLVGNLLAVDDIYVKNLDVMAAGTLTGDSDHKLVYATLSPRT